MILNGPFYYLYSANFKDMTNLVKEIWKELPYCNFYLISNYGQVKTTFRPVKQNNKIKMHKPKSVALTDNGRGYKFFGTKFNGKKKNFYIHRIVAELFLDNSKLLPEVNHKDCNKANNHVSNLEWVTIQENRDHATLNNLIPHGEGSIHARLTEPQVVEILRAAIENPKINRTELAKKYNVVDTAICRIISGKRWRRVWVKERGYSLSRLSTTEANRS